MTIAELGGLTFNGTEVPVGLHFRDIVDWGSLSALKDQPESRPQAHGAFDTRDVFREGAVWSIEGWYRGPSRIDALRMRHQLVGVLAGRDLTLKVTDELGPLTARVAVRAVPVRPVIGTRFEFAIDMFAADPRRYGPIVSRSTGLPVSGGGLVWPIVWPLVWAGGGSSGRITVTNPGTAATFSMYEVTGGMSGGFTIDEVGSGRQIRYEQAIPATSTVFLNPRTGATYLDNPGNDKSGALTRADWSPIPEFGSSVLQFNALGDVTGTPTLTARTAPANW